MDKHIMFTIFSMFYVVGITGDDHYLLRKNDFGRFIDCYGQMVNANILKGIKGNGDETDEYETDESNSKNTNVHFDKILEKFYLSYYATVNTENCDTEDYWVKVMEAFNTNFDTEEIFTALLINFISCFEASESNEIQQIVTHLQNETDELNSILKSFIDNYKNSTELKPVAFCMDYMKNQLKH